jgi:hypothetical protein
VLRRSSGAKGVMLRQVFPGACFAARALSDSIDAAFAKRSALDFLSELLSHCLLCSLRTSGAVLIQGRRVATTSVGVAIPAAKGCISTASGSASGLLDSID